MKLSKRITFSYIQSLLLISSLLLSSTVLLADTTADMKRANELYIANQYDEAVQAYEGIVSSGYESSSLYYNLGNAYYRQNRIAPSILNYERALRLDPQNTDVQYNLALARAKTLDKIEANPKNIFEQWVDSLIYQTHTNIWAIWSMILFVCSLGLLLLYMLASLTWLRKTAFFSAAIMLIASILFFTFSYVQKQQIENKKEAIISLSTVTIKSSPDEQSSDLFIIHEGTKVSIKHQLGSWAQIETEDGNKGWLPLSTIEKI